MTVSLLALLWEFLVKLLPILEPCFSHLFGDDGNGELLCRNQWEEHVVLKDCLAKPENGKVGGHQWDLASS